MGLVEVLVSLLVLGTGVLGLALLLLDAIGDARSASFRTRALALEADLADRIRANPDARGAYVLEAGADPPSPRGCASGPGSPAAACSAADLAEDDLADWLARVRSELPKGEEGPGALLSYTAVAVPPLDRYELQLRWQDHDEQLVRRSQVLVAQGLVP